MKTLTMLGQVVRWPVKVAMTAMFVVSVMASALLLAAGAVAVALTIALVLILGSVPAIFIAWMVSHIIKDRRDNPEKHDDSDGWEIPRFRRR